MCDAGTSSSQSHNRSAGNTCILSEKAQAQRGFITGPMMQNIDPWVLLSKPTSYPCHHLTSRLKQFPRHPACLKVLVCRLALNLYSVSSVLPLDSQSPRCPVNIFFFKCVNTFLSTPVLPALVFPKQPSFHLYFALLGIEFGKALLYFLSDTLEETGAVDS